MLNYILPDTFLSKNSGDINLVVGPIGSGRSILIRSTLPDKIFQYKPQFRNDRKILIETLSGCQKNIFIGIESSMPTLGENSDAFLKEIALMGKLQKQSYVIEWECSSQQKILIGTSSKYAKTIIFTLNTKKDVEIEDDELPRFAAIKTILDGPTADWVLEYHVLKSQGARSLESEIFKYNVSEFVENTTRGD